ncbi:unnamed protein product, partial [Ectocarpus sp. 12 AP-2014]
MHLYPKRALLEGAELEIFKLLSFGATAEQWAEWLRAPLEHAAARGNLDLVERLLKAGANGGAGWRGCRGRTMLDAAALGGNPDVVATLLAWGCASDVNVVSVSSRRSALHVAAVCGHEAVAKKLIIAGADVNRVDPGDACVSLHVAIEGGHVNMVDNFLMSGACPNSRTRLGRTPLHLAAASGNNRVVSTLLGSTRTDVDALDNEGYSPLMVASEGGHCSTVEVLLRAGAVMTPRYYTAGAHLCMTALDLAAEKGHVGVVEAIVENGGDVRAANTSGFTALHYARRGEVVNVLLDAGADVSAKPSRELHWATPVLVCAMDNRCEAMVALLKRGGNVNDTSCGGVSALHLACGGLLPGVDRMVDLLLRWGASETAVNDNGRTPSDVLEATAYRVGDPATRHDSLTKEMHRARVLLARAPVDRTWRRRCWLVMLRARVEREREAPFSVGGSGSNRTQAKAGRNLPGHEEADGSSNKV